MFVWRVEGLHEVELGRPAARRTRRGTAGGRTRSRSRVQRPLGEAVGVHGSERFEPRVVGGVEAASSLRARARCPPRATRGPPRRTAPAGQRALELREQVAQRLRKPARRPRRRARETGRRRSRRRDRSRQAERPGADAGRAGDVTHQAREGRHLRAEHQPGAGELTRVVGRHPPCGTTRTGSRGQRGAEALETAPALAALAGPVISVKGMVGPIGARAGREERQAAGRLPADSALNGYLDGCTAAEALRVATLPSQSSWPHPDPARRQ